MSENAVAVVSVVSSGACDATLFLFVFKELPGIQEPSSRLANKHTHTHRHNPVLIAF